MRKYLKTYLKDLIKVLIFHLLLLFGFYNAIAAVSWPSTPTGEVNGGLFQSYFNKIFVQCPSGQTLQGYNITSGKICTNIKY